MNVAHLQFCFHSKTLMQHWLPLKHAQKKQTFVNVKLLNNFDSEDNEPKEKMVLADWKWWYIAEYYSVK